MILWYNAMKSFQYDEIPEVKTMAFGYKELEKYLIDYDMKKKEHMANFGIG